MRAAGRLSEIRADDLAFNVQEASSLLASRRHRIIKRRRGGAHAPDGRVARRLYLAALSLVDRTNPGEFVHHFSGNNRFIGDYLTEEVLARQTAEVRNFILDMSIVDRFSAPLPTTQLDGMVSRHSPRLATYQFVSHSAGRRGHGSVSITFLAQSPEASGTDIRIERRHYIAAPRSG